MKIEAQYYLSLFVFILSLNSCECSESDQARSIVVEYNRVSMYNDSISKFAPESFIIESKLRSYEEKIGILDQMIYELVHASGGYREFQEKRLELAGKCDKETVNKYFYRSNNLRPYAVNDYMHLIEFIKDQNDANSRKQEVEQFIDNYIFDELNVTESLDILFSTKLIVANVKKNYLEKITTKE